MFDRIRKALVKSFVGAIAIGWLFAQGILHFAFMFAVPVSDWMGRRMYRRVPEDTGYSTGFSLQPAVPELIRSVALLLLAYILLRWLYFEKPVREVNSSQDVPPLESTDAG